MKEIIEKIRKGDGLNDVELERAITHYSVLQDMLNEHGELYYLTWSDVFYTLTNLKIYRNSRERKKASGEA